MSAEPAEGAHRGVVSPHDWFCEAALRNGGQVAVIRI